MEGGSPLRRSVVFQTSLMSALLDGVYEGDMTVGELLRHGDFGLGTFNALDGEMIILDGTCYQLHSDGRAHPAATDRETPFAVVTHFRRSATVELPEPLTRDDVQRVVETLTPSQNYLYAVRLTGRFTFVATRTVARQHPPYRPLVEVTKGDVVRRLDDVSGVLAGFRTPLYERGIGVPGGHLHFIDDARQTGGHVLDYRTDRVTLDVSIGTELHLSLPLTGAFAAAHLTPDDLSRQIEETEDHR